jgi:hypothetical protein
MKAKRTLLALEGIDLDKLSAATTDTREAARTSAPDHRRVAVHARRR